MAENPLNRPEPSESGNQETEGAKSDIMPDVTEKPKAEPNADNKKKRFPKLRRFNRHRNWNTKRYSTLNTFLLIIFPLFICSMAEINQAKEALPFLKLLVNRPSVVFFDYIIAGLIFILLLLIFKIGWIASAVQSFIYMALSTVELFKYNTNGNHLILSDMKLAKSVKSLTSFAYIKITWRLILAYIVVIAFVLLVFYLNPKIHPSPVKRIVGSVCCIAPFIALVIFPSFYQPVYSFFGVDTTDASNDILLKEKFKQNSFLAFLIETASESYANRLVEPENYSQESIDEIMQVDVEGGHDFNGGEKPNVIVVMSESYADFRVFDQLDDRIDDSIYSLFDKACEEGHSGTIITPTYASWTVRSEFELILGLPVRGINDPNMPQRELADRVQPALAQYYNTWGYNTAYIHPFQGTFYGRLNKYPYFGFDKLMFHDDYEGTSDFDVDVDYYGTYVDDMTVFNQITKLINDSDEPLYVHTTTMQNHQPYDQGDQDEFGNYLTWIKHTNEDLEVFLDDLEKIDEPTLVFFVGDHFPSLRGETSVYNQVGITSENCDVLYQQKYLLWSNYDADFSTVPDQQVSFFYMPYVLLNIIDAPRDEFIQTMMNKMQTEPVYSTSYDNSTPRDPDLDMLTYDRVVGELYSTSPVKPDPSDD